MVIYWFCQLKPGKFNINLLMLHLLIEIKLRCNNECCNENLF